MAKVIESFSLVHKTTKLSISPYGSLPYGEYADWEKVTRGFTIAWDDGTVGTGRVPFKTREEAQTYLDAATARGFKGMGAY